MQNRCSILLYCAIPEMALVVIVNGVTYNTIVNLKHVEVTV